MSNKSHLINTFIEESQASVFVADKGALLYETDEHLCLGHQGVKLLMGTVSALQESYEEMTTMWKETFRNMTGRLPCSNQLQ